MDLLLLWIWLRVDALSFGLQGVLFLSLIGSVGLLIGYVVSADSACEVDQNIHNKCKKALARTGPLAVAIMAILIALPSSKDIAIMVSYSFGKDALQSETGKKAQALLLGKANEILDSELAKLKR